ncbi:YdcF family protein [Enterococcus raffinosus]|uniref:YdcF family protein n=1 Tax=Enterococcus raffinosus TaxID=71452 RepID=UPI001C969059|nr:YdcF family protein [Enterococcus raffinosus]
MFVVFVCLALLVITGAVLVKERRSMIGGLLFALSGMLLSLLGLFKILFRLAESSEIGGAAVLGIVYGLFPLLFLAIILAFIFNTRTMSTKEGRSFTAKLSALLGANLLIVVPLFLYLVTMDKILPYIIHSLLFFLVLVDLLMVLFFVCYLFYSWMYQMIPVKKQVDYLIVLGAGIRSEEVTPLLKSRLDKALEYFKKNKEAYLVVSGGQGPDEPVSEAVAMKKYLLSQGVDEHRILLEDQSTTTLENMKFSKKIIARHWQKAGTPNVLFSTNNYHVLRGAVYARKAGLKADGIGAPTAFYFLPSALIREYIAMLVQFKWFSGLIILLCLSVVLYSILPI